MATPQVSGGVALLMQRHPSWTVEEIKSALVQTGDPVHGANGQRGVGAPRGRRPDRPRPRRRPAALRGADLDHASRSTAAPCRSTSPTPAAAPAPGRSRSPLQDPDPGVTVDVARQRLGPGRALGHRHASASSAPNGDVTGFVVLTHGADTRRIPFWVEVDHPLLADRARDALYRTRAPTRRRRVGGESKVSHYRYPTAGDGSYPGPEVVYRVHITQAGRELRRRRPLRAAPSRTSSSRATRTTSSASPALPADINPYLEQLRRAPARSPAPSCPAPGNYEIVFDTRSARRARARSRSATGSTTRRRRRIRVVSTRARDDHGLDHRRGRRRRPRVDHGHPRRPQRRSALSATGSSSFTATPGAPPARSSPPPTTRS